MEFELSIIKTPPEDGSFTVIVTVAFGDSQFELFEICYSYINLSFYVLAMVGSIISWGRDELMLDMVPSGGGLVVVWFSK